MLHRRITVARKEADLTQDEFAKRLGLNHAQSVSAMEAGSRSVSAEELLNIMEITGRSFEFFTDPYMPVGEGQFSFRARNVEEPALEAFQEKAGRWVAAYRHLGSLRGEQPSPISHALKLKASDTFEKANAAAEALVEEWELGDVPAEKLERVIDGRLGIPVWYIDPEYEISGVACRAENFSAIMIRRQDVEGRRNYDLAHELFHVLTWDAMRPAWNDKEVWQQRGKGRYQRIEQLANSFASGLLMPEEHLRRLWDERGRKRIDNWMLAVAQQFKVSVVALKWRLVNLGLCRTEDVDGAQSLNDSRNREPLPRPFSGEFAKRLHWALEEGRLSARKAAIVMDCTLDDLTDLFASYDLEPPFDL
jgi:Zn-dependent peptidase ImmA (M78 family)/transcriptional regulator with XRE-family HTH domain